MPSAIAAVAAAAAAAVSAQTPETIHYDPAGDAAIRRTDTGASGPLNPATVLPDFVSVALATWEADYPASDPYTGRTVDPAGAHLFRIQIVFLGLVNPPGTLGLGGNPFDPFKFGPSPVHGFLDLDIDRDENTGGELGGAATLRYLANVARFGRVASGSKLGGRTARWAKDYDGYFGQGIQYERSGADFALVMCGCSPVTIVTQDGNYDGIFDPGETWVVRGRFFQRAAGFQLASGAYGGSAFGLYDPWVNLRFSHSLATNRTTVTLVYALDPVGAGLLAGTAPQPVDLKVNNQTCVVEGLQDIIDRAASASGPTGTLVEGWRGRDPYQFLEVPRWTPTALFGTSYSEPRDGLYVWTDTGCYDYNGDLDADGAATPADRAIVQATITALDGTPDDADGIVNGSVRLQNFGPNFHASDVTGDGVIDSRDLAFYCPVDFTGDGVLDVLDFIAFQNEFALGTARADFNKDGRRDILDFVAFQNAFAIGCP